MKKSTEMLLTAAIFAVLLSNMTVQGILPIKPVLGSITDVVVNHLVHKLDMGKDWLNKIQAGVAIFIKARKVGLQVPKDEEILVAKLQRICQQDSETYGLNGQMDKDHAPIDPRNINHPIIKPVPSMYKFTTGGNSIDMCTDILRALGLDSAKPNQILP